MKGKATGIVKGSLGLAMEKKWQRIGEGRSGIVKGKAIHVVMEVRYRESCRGSCRGKEMAENRRRQVRHRERESYSCVEVQYRESYSCKVWFYFILFVFLFVVRYRVRERYSCGYGFFFFFVLLFGNCFYFFLNDVLTWKIMEASKASVIYIYI